MLKGSDLWGRRRCGGGGGGEVGGDGVHVTPLKKQKADAFPGRVTGFGPDFL